MSKPIEATPDLEGEEVVRFFKRIEKNEKNPIKTKDIKIVYDDELKKYHKQRKQEVIKLYRDSYMKYQDKEDIILDVADFFLQKQSMTFDKLNLLCYYAYVWFIVYANDIEQVKSRYDVMTLGKYQFCVGDESPFCSAIWKKYKKFRWSNIVLPEDHKNISFDSYLINDVLNLVWNDYGDMNGIELISLSRSEKPYRRARQSGNERYVTRYIDELYMLKFYSKFI